MSGNPRICKIIRALQVAKHYWFSETAKCGDCAVWRFSNYARRQTPQSGELSSNSAKSEAPKAGNSQILQSQKPQSGQLSNTPLSGNPRTCEIIGALEVAKHYWFSDTAKCGNCAAWRFLNFAHVRNPPNGGFSNFTKSETPQSG